jgi:hypothetical protein
MLFFVLEEGLMNQAALAIAGEIRRRRGNRADGDGHAAPAAEGGHDPAAQRAQELALVDGMVMALSFAIGKPFDVQAAEDLISQPAGTGGPSRAETDGLIAWAGELGLRPEDLDELVHELVSGQASSINNGGLEDQIEFLVQTCGPREARSLIEQCSAGPLEVIADLRGSMVDGYDDEDVNRVLGRISDASGQPLVCVWDIYDDCGVGGNSQFYLLEGGGRLRELTGDLWRWLNGDPEDPDTPASPGLPGSWAGELAGFTTEDLPYDDGFRNYAHRDIC